MIYGYLYYNGNINNSHIKMYYELKGGVISLKSFEVWVKYIWINKMFDLIKIIPRSLK